MSYLSEIIPQFPNSWFNSNAETLSHGTFFVVVNKCHLTYVISLFTFFIQLFTFSPLPPQTVYVYHHSNVMPAFTPLSLTFLTSHRTIALTLSQLHASRWSAELNTIMHTNKLGMFPCRNTKFNSAQSFRARLLTKNYCRGSNQNQSWPFLT